MPYLQLDTPFPVSLDARRRLADEMGAIYAATMNADPRRITVAVRALGEGTVWRCGEDGARPCALLMCDIRRGRDAATRARLAEALVAACVAIAGLTRETLNVEFTQHDGDEMYHTMYGGLSRDWSPDAPDTLPG